MEKIKEDKSICRAKITPVVDDSFDFEAVAVPTENGQINYSFQNEEYFLQVLRTGKENIDGARLDSGIPLFDNHPYENSAVNTLGITTEYSFDERGLVVRAKFGSRADQALRDDVKNGIIKTMSIEGIVLNYAISREVGKLPIYSADLWLPLSLSFAPVPQDIGAQIEVKRAIKKQIEIELPKETFYKTLTNKFKK